MKIYWHFIFVRPGPFEKFLKGITNRMTAHISNEHSKENFQHNFEISAELMATILVYCAILKKII